MLTTWITMCACCGERRETWPITWALVLHGIVTHDGSDLGHGGGLLIADDADDLVLAKEG